MSLRPQPSTTDLFTAAPLPVAPLDDRARLACLRLIRSDGVGPVTFRELINHYGGAEAALEALPDLSRQGGRRRPPRICTAALAEAELEAASRAGAVPLFTIEPGYPVALAAVDAPPPLLYVRGQIERLNQPAIAIVGSRSASAAGVRLARHFARELGAAGFVVVSGLARGIDRVAHEATIDSGTIAVLAGGMNIVYPPEHAQLQEAIGTLGCLVTEQPAGFTPRAQDFPRRNRLISGLSLAVLVVEAARRSGTLVTARFAGEHGREVFAVPGHPLDPRAEGTNQLLKNGATLVTEPADILEALAPMMREPVTALWASVPAPVVCAPSPRSLDEGSLDGVGRESVVGVLGPQPATVDDIVRATGLEARVVRVALMELDLAGRIERHGHQLVSLRSSLPSTDV